MQIHRAVVGSKKRPNKFGAEMKREKVVLAPEYSPVPTTSSQTSVTESLDILELSAKVPRVCEETQNKIIAFWIAKNIKQLCYRKNSLSLQLPNQKYLGSSLMTFLLGNGDFCGWKI